MNRASEHTILHVVNSLDGGGTERVLVDLLREFSSRGRCCERHVVVTLRQAGRLAAQLPPKMACHPLSPSGKSRLTAARLGHIAHRWGASVLHARGAGCWADALVAKLMNPRLSVVLGFHGSTNGGFTRRDRFIARAAGLLSARFATVAQSGVAQLRGELGVPADCIDYLPNGVDADAVGEAGVRAAQRESFGFGDDAFVIGAVGSLTLIKRHDLLIEALSDLRVRHPIVRLLILGDGPLRKSLEAAAAAGGVSDSVIFAGWRDNIREALSAVDAYVCSSDSECMSNAVLEALAAGLPTVVTGVGDNALIVRDDRDGIVVPPGTLKPLVAALESLIECPKRRIRLSQAACRRAQRFRFKDSADNYLRYYQGLVATRQGIATPAAEPVTVPNPKPLGAAADEPARRCFPCLIDGCPTG